MLLQLAGQNTASNAHHLMYGIVMNEIEIDHMHTPMTTDRYHTHLRRT
jgi:hypothetical protein